jgi:hypothetical protein
MKEDILRDELLRRAPELAEDYKRFVRHTFKRMQEALGETLKGVGSSWTWSRTYDAIKGNLKQDWGGRSVLMYEESLKIPYQINEEALGRNAQAYGERVALEWYNKMRAKLGDLESVTVVDAGTGGDVLIKGRIKGHDVAVEQHRIINASSRGLLFHQFPARIYVDGKFMSEAAYRKLVGGAPSSKAARKPTGPVMRGLRGGAR